MLHIYLPGYSAKNLNELIPITEVLNNEGFKTYSYQWRHWDNENEEWNIEKDLEIIL